MFVVNRRPVPGIDIGPGVKIVRGKELTALTRASAVLDEAHRVASRMVSEAQREIEAAHRQAYEDGLARGHAEGLARHTGRLDGHLAALRADETILADVVGQALEATVGALDDGARIRGFVGKALARICAAHGSVRVHVNPAQADKIEPLVARWSERYPELDASVIADASVPANAYRIEGGTAGAQWTLADDLPTALTALKQVLKA